jgi:hypothetical protein
VSARAYPTEEVECPRCDGLGEDLYAPDDPLDWHGNRCTFCFGHGTVTVCANCYDVDDGCAACVPEYVGCSRCGGTGGTPAGPFGAGRATCTDCGGSGSLRRPPVHAHTPAKGQSPNVLSEPGGERSESSLSGSGDSEPGDTPDG